MGGGPRSFPATPRAGRHTSRVLGTKMALSPLSALGSEGCQPFPVHWPSPVCFPASFCGRLIPTLNPSNPLSFQSTAWLTQKIAFPRAGGQD